MSETPFGSVVISSASVSADGGTVTFSLQDETQRELTFSMSFEALGHTIVKLLAVAHTAKAQRQKSGKLEPDVPLQRDILLPFPLKRYELGVSDDGARMVLRLIADNDLIWDFLAPCEALESLCHDVSRLKMLVMNQAGETS